MLTLILIILLLIILFGGFHAGVEPSMLIVLLAIALILIFVIR